MTRNAFDFKQETRRTIDGSDHAYRQIKRFQHRALLDVQLHKSQYFIAASRRVIHAIRGKAVLAQGIA